MKKNSALGCRLTAMLLIVALLTALLPVTALGSASYGRTNVDKVFLRKTANSEVYYGRMPLGWVSLIEGTVVKDGKEWYKVRTNDPDEPQKMRTGYILGSCLTLMTPEECDAWEKNPVQVGQTSGYTATPAPGQTTQPVVTAPPTGSSGGVYNGYGRVTVGVTNLRATPSADGDVLAPLVQNTIVKIVTIPVGTTSDDWYCVTYESMTGYIVATSLALTTDPAPTTPPVTPSGTLTPASGYIKLTQDKVNFRAAPDGTVLTKNDDDKLPRGLVLPYSGVTTQKVAGYYWAKVTYKGTEGFIRSDCYTYSDANGNPVVTPTPIPVISPTAPGPVVPTGGYLILTIDKVNLRKTPGGVILTPLKADKLPKGLITPYYATTTQKVSGYYWSQIIYNGMTGYVRSDCYRFCDEHGAFVVTPTPAYATATPSVPSSGYIKLLTGGVNMRHKATTDSDRYGQLSQGTVLPYFSTTTTSGSLWYYVYSTKFSAYGYVMGSFAQICNSDGSPISVVTPKPDGSYGYCATTISSVWLRKTADTKGETDGKTGSAGAVFKLWAAPFVGTTNKYIWYPVLTNAGDRAYIRGDCAYLLADWQVDEYNRTGVLPTPTPGPSVAPVGQSNFLITTADNLYVRKAASTKSGNFGQVNSGEVFEILGKSVVGQVTWYKIQYTAVDVAWLHGDFVRVMTNEEYLRWLGGQPTATPKPGPTALPDPSQLSDVALTTLEKVNIRGSASMSGKELIRVDKAGTKLTYLGAYRIETDYTWFNVKYAGVSGWMRGDCVRVLTRSELAVYNLTGDPDSPPEASYNTLRLGSTGDEVKNVQDKLLEKGYLKAGSYTQYSYDSATEAAVRAFQKAQSLSVDGVAGEQTQHRLFNTVPVGTYTGSDVPVTLYPVEMVDWYTGDIQSLFSVGKVAVVTDVYTGISLRMERLYGDNHADVEPLTTSDTAAYCRIFGVTDPQDISDYESKLESYRRRPLWVTIGTRTIAGSLYGVPHNFDGDRIPDNNFNGQVCIHFTNSKTHGKPPIVDPDASYNGYFGHQSAIKYAYTHSISGTK